MPVVQTSELLPMIEEAAVKNIAFGDSRAIRNQYVLCQKRRLSSIAKKMQSAGALLTALQRTHPDNQYASLGNTVVRCAIQHAHSQVALDVEYGLQAATCDDIFRSIAGHVRSNGGGTPLDYGLTRLSDDPEHSCGSWVWTENHLQDLFGSVFRSLVRLNYGNTPLCTLTTAEFQGLSKGFNLLFALVPSLASSALSHTHLIACFSEVGIWRGRSSSSQFFTGGTIFLNRLRLNNPWWVAEHLLHESLHQKLYDFRHGHTLLDEKYLRPEFPRTELAKVWSPWNPEKLNKSNFWNTHRALAAFHVYVHLALLSQVAEECSSKLEEIFGPRNGMIESRRALDRARYLGEQLRQGCWHELGPAGRNLVNWLVIMLDGLDSAPAPKGAYLHHVLDLYDRESRQIETALESSNPHDSALFNKLCKATKEDCEEMQEILKTVGSEALLDQFREDAASAPETNPELYIPHIRKSVTKICRALFPNGYEIPQLDKTVDPNEAVTQMIRQSSEKTHTSLSSFPEAVVAAKKRARTTGFTKSCVNAVGRLLATLSAAVPQNGRILEIGTAAGVGTAWIVSGLAQRNDVEVISIEIDDASAKSARLHQWPSFVKIVTADALETMETNGKFDLVFADIVPCKYDYLPLTLNLLKPGAFLLVDDLRSHAQRATIASSNIAAFRGHLLSKSTIQAVELDWASGVILAVARRIT